MCTANIGPLVKNWVHIISKVFAMLSDCQKNILLAGRIYPDETYFPIVPEDESRKSDEKHYRSISRNNICV